MNKRILSFLIGVATMMCNGTSCGAQTKRESYVDIFSGVEFNYRNIYYNNKLYDLLINLTPGFKWHLKQQWMIAAEGYVPIYNDYGERYKRIRLNMAVVSKEAQWGKQFFKFSGGLFGRERYGVDVKWMYPMNHWLAVDAQIGYTGFCSMAVDWECSKMERVTGWIGARMYIEKLNTEFRLQGGRYIYEDYGVKGECMRHFKHCTVGVYAQYSDWGEENFGFKIVMMIPPYKRKMRKVNFRPASNFRLTYNLQADPYSMLMYRTDPEENEREGNFNRDSLQWGANRMPADFSEKEGGSGK